MSSWFEKIRNERPIMTEIISSARPEFNFV